MGSCARAFVHLSPQSLRLQPGSGYQTALSGEVSAPTPVAALSCSHGHRWPRSAPSPCHTHIGHTHSSSCRWRCAQHSSCFCAPVIWEHKLQEPSRGWGRIVSQAPGDIETQTAWRGEQSSLAGYLGADKEESRRLWEGATWRNTEETRTQETVSLNAAVMSDVPGCFLGQQEMEVCLHRAGSLGRQDQR